MFSWFAVLMTVAGLVLAGLAAYVAWRRRVAAGVSLAVLLLSVAWWGLAYAVELSVTDIADKSLWGDLKYIGTATVAPAWLVFVLRYTDRPRWLTRWLLGALVAEPVALLAVLFNPATHDLVRSYPPDAAGQALPVVQTGPVFWAHFAYSNALIVVATGLFLATMVRLSRTYLEMALILVAAALLPWIANLLHNFEVGWFTRVDLTPFAFTLTGGVLVWGLFRERLLRLSPLARGVIVERMSDAVFILDAFGRLADLNPAGGRLLGRPPADLVGLPLDDLLPATGGHHPREVVLPGEDGPHTYDVNREPLRDRRDRPAGELVILRDVTERARSEELLSRFLAERSRVAAALQQSLVPARLTPIPRSVAATRYEPAGDGREIGGDFFDVFPLDGEVWGLVLGDVSGKGAEAAAVTAMARYTLRTIAEPGRSPCDTLLELNQRLLAATDLERHCTLVFAHVRPCHDGLRLTLSLAGHHQPLVRRRDGTVEPVGRLGTALGLLEEAEAYDEEVLLEEGDLICFFTDGLVEARRDGAFFGIARVAEILARPGPASVEDLASELMDAVHHFHGSRLADDLALLILRATPPAAGR